MSDEWPEWERCFHDVGGFRYATVSAILGKSLAHFHSSKIKHLMWKLDNDPDAQGKITRDCRLAGMVRHEVERFLLGDRPSCSADVVDTPSLAEMMSFGVPRYLHYLEPLLREIENQNGPDHLWPGLMEGSSLVGLPLRCRYGFADVSERRCWFEGKYTAWTWKVEGPSFERGAKKKLYPISRYSEARVRIASHALAHNIELVPDGNLPPVEQGAICVCYDWCQPFLYLMPMSEIRGAAHEFIERFGAYQALENSVFPRPVVEFGHHEPANDFSKF